MVVQIVLIALLLAVGPAFGIYCAVNRRNSVFVHRKDESRVVLGGDGKNRLVYLILTGLYHAGLIVLLVGTCLKWIEGTSVYLCWILLALIAFLSIQYLANDFFSFLEFSDADLVENKPFRKKRRIAYEAIERTSCGQDLNVVLYQGNALLTYFSARNEKAAEAVEIMRSAGIRFDKEVLQVLKLPSDTEETEAAESEGASLPEEEAKGEEKPEWTKAQIEAYTEIGKEFRENARVHRRNDIVKAVLFQLVCLGVVVLLCLLFRSYFMAVLLLVNVYLAYSKVKELRAKYDFQELSDFELGKKYAHLNPKVIGYHRMKNRAFKSTAIMVGILLAVLIGFSAYTLVRAKPLDYNDKTEIRGTLKSIVEETYVTIRIDDDENQYADCAFLVPNALNGYIQKEQMLRETIDQEVAMRVVLDDDKKNATVYYVRIGETEYVNQETLDAYYRDYLNQQWITLYVTIALEVVLIGGSVGYYLYNRAEEKKETIDLRKSA